MSRDCSGWKKPRAEARPMTYTPEEVSSIIQTALSHPRDLGEDYANWTLDRLVEHLHRVKGIRMQRSRISELFIARSASGGGTKKSGLASGSIPTSPKKGGPSRPFTPPLQKTL